MINRVVPRVHIKCCDNHSSNTYSIVHGVRNKRKMASLHLQVPEHFDFRSPDDWPRWKKRFEQFHLTSGLVSESETRQISALLYCLGGDAEDVLSSTNITEDERKQ